MAPYAIRIDLSPKEDRSCGLFQATTYLSRGIFCRRGFGELEARLPIPISAKPGLESVLIHINVTERSGCGFTLESNGTRRYNADRNQSNQ